MMIILSVIFPLRFQTIQIKPNSTFNFEAENCFPRKETYKCESLQETKRSLASERKSVNDIQQAAF